MASQGSPSSFATQQLGLREACAGRTTRLLHSHAYIVAYMGIAVVNLVTLIWVWNDQRETEKRERGRETERDREAKPHRRSTQRDDDVVQAWKANPTTAPKERDAHRETMRRGAHQVAENAFEPRLATC